VSAVKGLSLKARTEADPESSWQTPPTLLRRVREAFGGTIDLDPCTTPDNPCEATRFWTPSDDGILQAWVGPNIYVNPPYGYTIKHWVEKSIVASVEGNRVILLVPARTSSGWFREAALKANAILFLSRRLAFKGVESKGTVGRFDNVLLGLNHDLAALADLGLRMTPRESDERETGGK
jgi:phage N-6-adenine-methyltransferase